MAQDDGSDAGTTCQPRGCMSTWSKGQTCRDLSVQTRRNCAEEARGLPCGDVVKPLDWRFEFTIKLRHLQQASNTTASAASSPFILRRGAKILPLDHLCYEISVCIG